ncbi:MAG: HtaA domain-containing protein [Pontimonas sp.]
MREFITLALASLLGVVPAAAPEGACEVREVTITWGFKESFRSYISGAIAQGSWDTSGDVGYSLPEFTFTGGEGYVTPDRTNADVSFDGELVFSGHEGILETTLANPRLTVVDTRSAVLFVDVTGDTMDEVSVSETDVPFARVVWGSSDEAVVATSGLWEIRGAEVVLTEEGSAAFGTYPAGEVMDPMSASFGVNEGCLQGTGVGWIPGGAAALAVVASAIALAIRRGRKSPGPEHP